MSETMTITKIQQIIEAALMAYEAPMSVTQLANLFDEAERPDSKTLKIALENLQQACDDRGVELKQVASGYRYQAKQECAPWLKKLWEERPPRYSRALLETLALVIYRQPITRAEIEEVRGVAVSSNIVRTLMERGWVKEVGQRDVPGKPALLGTTKEFLDYFNVQSLTELPSLQDLADLDIAGSELEQQMQLLEQEQTQALIEEDKAAADAIEHEIERHPIQLLDEDQLDAEIAAIEAKFDLAEEPQISEAEDLAQKAAEVVVAVEQAVSEASEVHAEEE